MTRAASVLGRLCRRQMRCSSRRSVSNLLPPRACILTDLKICNSNTDTLSESIVPTSTRFAVAVHTLAALAVSDGKPMRSEDLAYSANTSPVVIRGLVSRLSDAGLTRSQLGAGGGSLLAKPAGKIRLLDVYEAVEDTELFSLHRTPPCESCAVGGNILEAMQPTLTRARKALENELAKVTIAAIAAEVARRQGIQLSRRRRSAERRVGKKCTSPC